MAEVNVEKKQSEGRDPQESQGLQRGPDMGVSTPREILPSFWRDPLELFSMNPFAMMRRFTEEMDRAFSAGRSDFGASRMWSPAVEVSERDGKMLVHAELPGLSKDDVKIEVTGDVLIIQGERKREHQEEEKGFRRSERSYGSFCRYIPLPQGAHTDEAQAKFENGVLEVSIPVPAQQRSRREIPVQTGSGDRKQVSSETSAEQREAKAG